MTNPQKRYPLDDDLKRGYQEKPILKEEQRKILEKLLDVDRNRLSPEEQLLMQKLVGQLESDSQRVKEIRKRIEGRGSLSEIISLLQQDREAIQRPAVQVVEEPAPPSAWEEPPAPVREAPEKKKPRRRKPVPLSEESVVRPQPKPEPTGKPKPWKEIIGAREAKVPPAAPAKPVARGKDTPPGPPQEAVPSVAAEPLPVDVKPAAEPEPVAPAAAPASKAKFSPVEVVKRYVRAWNLKAFAAEYECFSPAFIEMSKETYVDRRMATYLSYNRDGKFLQEMGTVLKTHLDGDLAEVLCTRSVREFHKLNYYLDLYVLKLENGQWRITGVTTAITRQSSVPLSDPRRFHGTTS